MARGNVLEITLSNVEGRYYAGQQVMGHCTLDLGQPCNVNSLYLVFRGKASVWWGRMYEVGYGNNTQESYINDTCPVIGGVRDTETNARLPAGRHTFPFSYHLPAHLPSSFLGQHGSVTYSVTAVVNRPWGTHGFHRPLRVGDLQTERHFTVIGLLDLNLVPQAEVPTEVEKETEIGCVCCESGSVKARFGLQRRSHVLGEPLQFRATINNRSDREVGSCSIYLHMMTTYRARFGIKHVWEKLCRIAAGAINPGKTVSWLGSREQLIIPPDLAPSGMPGCSVIDVEYSVTLTVHPSCASKMKLSVPLTIGTLPSRYAVTLDPSGPCRPLQMTPQVGYPPVPPPGEDGRAPPSAPALESSGTFPTGDPPRVSASVSDSARVLPPDAVDLPEAIAGQPPPSYAEYMQAEWKFRAQVASTDLLDQNQG